MLKMSDISRQIQRIECEKCLKVDWFNLWCKDGFCDAVDPRRHLSYFYDTNHCTTYGAMYIADYMFNIYKNASQINRFK